MKVAVSGPIIRILLAMSFFVMGASPSAETLSFASFQMEMEDGWKHGITGGDGEQVTIYGPDGKDTLEILAFHAPQSVSAEALRNMTNVDHSVPLTWQEWGDYSGYQYDYAEGSSFYRQWWLAKDTEILLVVHTSDALSSDIEIELIDKMLRSLTAIR